MSPVNLVMEFLLARLVGTTSAGERVFRRKEEALKPEQLPAIDLRLTGMRADGIGGGFGPVKRELTIEVRALVQGENHEYAGLELSAEAHRQLAMASDLGGLALSVSEGPTELVSAEEEGRLVMVVRSYAIKIETPYSES